MNKISAQFVGVELYFDSLEVAKKFYVETLGLNLSDEQQGHYAKFLSGPGSICLEHKGSESYPSQDKAVLFLKCLTSKLPSQPSERTALSVCAGLGRPPRP